MPWTEKQLNPFNGEPKFSSLKEEISWLDAMIGLYARYPDQMMQLYAASLIARKERLVKAEIESLEERLSTARSQIDYTNSSSGWGVYHLEEEIKNLKELI